MSLFRRRKDASSGGGISPSSASEASPFALAVLNPGGRDAEQHFPAGAGQPEMPGAPHPPINYHAYAACTAGSFHASTEKAIATGRPVLLLLRGDFGSAASALKRLHKAGRIVALACKETGTFQLARSISGGTVVRRMQKLAADSNGQLAATSAVEELWRGLQPVQSATNAETIRFIPTPYPVDDVRWNFSVPPSQRRGIFIGTREFATPSRQHLAAILSAKQLHAATGEPVTVLNVEGRRGAKTLRALGFVRRTDAPLSFVAGPLPYAEYLRLMARHRLVFQLDRSGVPGQVAGDAALCRLPCVGGDGAIERIVFPELTGHNQETPRLCELAQQLLTDATRYEDAWRDAQTRALERVSFRAVAAELAAFFWSLKAAAALRDR